MRDITRYYDINEIILYINPNLLSKEYWRDQYILYNLFKSWRYYFDAMKTFRQFKTGTCFSFSNTNIKKIENIDSLINLKNLYLNHNRIKKIENIDSLVNLKNLYLNNNRIEKIENLEGLINLQSLQLYNNRIKKIENLENLVNLQILHLYNNRIEKIENLETLINLRSVNLSWNKIRKIENLDIYDSSHPHRYMGRFKLEILYLNNNRIKIIENIDSLVNLQLLFISNNKVKTTSLQQQRKFYNEIVTFKYKNLNCDIIL